METKDLFNKMFSREDHIAAGDRYCKLPELLDNVMNSYENPEFYTINPIHAFIDFREREMSFKGGRAAINVTKLKNFLFEFDDMPIELQLNFLKSCDIPWTGIVFSGNKSYHAILSLKEPIHGPHTIEGVDRYKILHQRIAAFLNLKVKELMGRNDWEVDNSTKDPARLSRYPNSLRMGTKQKIVYIGEEMKEKDFNSLINKCPLVTTRKTVIVPPDQAADSLEKFWELCPDGLRRQIRYPRWAKPQGNYTQIYKLTLWAIDATGVSKDIWLTILNKYMFPWLAKQGYFRYEKGVHDAFKLKGE